MSNKEQNHTIKILYTFLFNTDHQDALSTLMTIHAQMTRLKKTIYATITKDLEHVKRSYFGQPA